VIFESFVVKGRGMSDDKFTHNPFGALAHLRGNEPAPKAPAAPAPVKETGAKTYARAVVRLERTGRGGKEVTAVEQIALSPSEREQWLKALKSGLGCGGTVEGDALVLQGDQRKRLPAILTSRGVKKVIVSG
jgi:translation initiation factor 1